MNNKPRIVSVLQTKNLDFSITGIPTFDLSALHLPTDLEFPLPTNLRLGHLVEKIVAELLKSATNYTVLYENTQIIEDKKTIGELDFIIQENYTKQVFHMELAYKFYLFDPHISSKAVNNWIGPNRNDSLIEKLDKLKTKQFPLLYHDCTRSTLNNLAIDQVSQALCLLISLFIPFEFKGIVSPNYQKAIKGYYINFQTFISHHSEAKTYYVPAKKDWGINPIDNEIWIDFESVKERISINMIENQAPLIWQKHHNIYSEFFVVWW
jgi:hypothetical protein